MLLAGDNCAYLRKSRTDFDAELRGEGDTLARHKKMLEDLSVKMNISIKKFYSEVVSGDTIEDRPVMRELLLDVQRGMWVGVFVVEIERLARGNTRDQGIVAECFKYTGTKIITPSKTYDPNDEFDEEYFEFGLFMARREYKIINRRLQRGRIASVQEGNYVSSTAPYGYIRIKNKNSKGYTLAINEEEAKVVRMVYDWYCNGVTQADGSIKLGTESIARRLDSLRIVPRKAKKWSRSSISDMLKNPTYYGDVRFGYRPYTKQIKDEIITTTRVINEDCSQNSGKHPAIINYDLFCMAQELKANNRTNTVPSTKVLQNPLSGLVYCKKCGALMTRLAPNTRNKYSTLKCPSRYCDNISSPLFLIEEKILNFLEEWTENYEVNIEAIDISINTPLEKEINVLKEATEINSAEILKLTKQLDKIYTLLEQEVYTLDIFCERQNTLNNSITSLIETNKKYKKEIIKLEKAKHSNEQFIPCVKNLLDTYSSGMASMQKALLIEVIERIEYQKDEPNTRGKLYNANFTLNIYPKLPNQ